METRQSVEIRIRGTVQGVGFRPFVWRLAREEGLVGEVLNDGWGVLIRATGDTDAIAELLKRLNCEAPLLAHIETVETTRLTLLLEYGQFRIAESVVGENRTRVAPDAAICAACRKEVLDSAERRYGYPFTNCTHCGPRFSIVKDIPYDRIQTTMAGFIMCPACAAEYADPADRRFHAQAIACPVCGPKIWLEVLDAAVDSAQAMTASPLETAVSLLNNGFVLAIRGLGGFHLACDATNAAAVLRLRTRKRRFGKPFALMARDLETVRRFCRVLPAEADLLHSPESPVVLLAAEGPEKLPPGVAAGLNTLGWMLPYTPLHLLIMQKISRPLVMTSGNISDEPQVTRLDDARIRLPGIADALLMHDRGVANRIDDSVVRIMAGEPQLIRRARGYCPSALPLPPGFAKAPDLLAYGGELKVTFCVVKDGAAVVSQHQGDLEDAATFEDYHKNLEMYARMYDHQPRLLVADQHPEYLSTKLARHRAALDKLPLLEVQHHHAHIASCLAENGIALDAPPVLGIALDGLGWGDDGTIWGGEFLLADYFGYRRLASFKPIAMPGGAQAIREPWRNTYAHLVAAMGWSTVVERFSTLALYRYLVSKPLATIDRMLARRLNVPLASSCGRLFDAVAAALGLSADHAHDEGQGAMQLEAAAAGWQSTGAETPYPFSISEDATSGLFRVDPSLMWQALLADLERQVPVGQMAFRFHSGLAQAIRDTVVFIRRVLDGGNAFDTVALSGGCLQNQVLLEGLVRLFEADKLKCLLHSKVPTNDGGLSLGQAAIAAARRIVG